MRCLLNSNGLLVSGRRFLPLAVAGPGFYRPAPPGEVGLGGTLMVALLKKKEAIWQLITAGHILATSRDLATNGGSVSSCLVVMRVLIVVDSF